jgi:WD40 repeat protein
MFLPGRERGVVFVRQGKWPKEMVTPELRDMATGNVLHRFPQLDSSTGASLSADGKRLALLYEGKLSVYSTETFERVAFVPDAGKAQMVHLSHDGKRAVVEVLMCAVALSSEATDMSWCPTPELTLWDLEKNEKLIQTQRGSGDGWVFTPDGEYLTGPETRLVDHIIRIRDGKELRFGSRIRTISPGSRRVLFESKLGFELAALDGQSPVPVLERAPKIMARSSDGKWHIEAGSDGRLRLESASSCMKLPLVVPTFGEPRSQLEYFSDSDTLTFSPDGLSLYTVLAATSMHARFRAFDTQTAVERWSIQATGKGVGIAKILPLSNQVLFQGYNHPDLRRFNAITGVELPKGGMPRVGYAVSPRGEAYDVRSPEGDRAEYLYAPISGHDGTRIAMSSSLESKCALSIWDVRNPRAVRDTYSGCLSVYKALSPDEKWIAAGTEKGGVLLVAWDNDETRRIEGMHEGKTTAIAFTPSGNRLAVADDFGNIVLADPTQRKIVGRARLPLDYAKRLWISPDSRIIVADTLRGMRVRFQINEQ